MSDILVKDMQDDLTKLIRALPADEADELAATLSDAVLETLSIAIMQSVPDNKLDELKELIAAGDFPALATFLKAHVPTLDDKVHESLARMKAETTSMLAARQSL